MLPPAPVWIERVIGAVAGCSAATDAEPAPATAPAQRAPTWKTAAGRCPSSPFAKSAALRQLLAQR
jgi:3-oxoacyl-ACP reductase-like protein